jgi:hypothetical protein
MNEENKKWLQNLGGQTSLNIQHRQQKINIKTKHRWNGVDWILAGSW